MLENNREEDLKKHLTKEIDSIKVPKGLKEEMWIQIKSARKKKRLHSKVLPLIAALACIAILVPLGLSALPSDSETTPSEVATIQEENTRTIETVLQNNLNGPDEELERIWNDMEDEEEIAAFRQYEENLYRDYFADDISYQEYVSSYGSVLWIEPMRNNYKLKVKDIHFEKTDSEEIIYNFTVELEYQKEGSELSEVGTVNGQANLNEEHKIEDMLIRTELWEVFSK